MPATDSSSSSGHRPTPVIPLSPIRPQVLSPNASTPSTTPEGEISASSLAYFGKEADGTEDGGTATVTTSSATDAAGAQVYRLQTGTYDPDIATWEHATAVAETTNADPPNLAPTHGSQDYLWIVVASHDNQEQTTVAPTNYTTLTNSDGDGAANDVGLATARRTLTASSENPGTFTSADEKWIAATIAIPPPLGGGPAGPTAQAGFIFLWHMHDEAVAEVRRRRPPNLGYIGR